MPAKYQDIDEARLLRLHDGLDILESIDESNGMERLDLFIYGLTTNVSVLDAAREALADEIEADETDVEVSEVAVAVPLYAGQIHRLAGSGVTLQHEEFAYAGPAGEGIRTSTFSMSSYKPAVAVSTLSRMAIASGSSYLIDFFKQYGNKTHAKVEERVRRTEEATQPGVPVPAPIPAAPAPEVPAPAMPKRTSLEATGDTRRDSVKIANAIESFLGELR
jgi:hypothetical protein